MAPARRKGSGRAAAAAAALQQWKVGDLVLAKMKGFPAWPAVITDPEKWGYSASKKKILVFFFGTKQIAFCNNAEIEAFTEEKKKILLGKRQGKGADFGRAVEEIIDSFDKQSQRGDEAIDKVGESFASDSSVVQGPSCMPESSDPDDSFQKITGNQPDDLIATKENNRDTKACEYSGSPTKVDDNLNHGASGLLTDKSSMLHELRQTPLATITSSRKRSREKPTQKNVTEKKLPSIRRSRSSARVDPIKLQCTDISANKDSITNIVLEPVVEHDQREHENIPHEKFSDNSACHDVVSVSFGAKTIENGTDKTVEAEFRAMSWKGNVPQQLKQKDEQHITDCPDGISKVKTDDGDHVGTIVLKKNRKSCAKRVSHSLTSDKLDKHGIQNDNQKDTLASVNSHRTTETVGNGDGDGHLPLVKRARARMRELHDKDKREETLAVCKSVKETSINICGNHNLPSKREHSSLDGCKPEAIPTSNDTIHSNGMDMPKVKNFQLASCIDVEAALPPSKRIHRALEAMSANVAEANNDDVEMADVHDNSSNECHNSSLVVPAVAVDCKTTECARDAQSSHCNGVLSSAFEVIPHVNPDKVEASSDANTNKICLETTVSPQQEECNESITVNKYSISPTVSVTATEAVLKSPQQGKCDSGDKADMPFQDEAIRESNVTADVEVIPVEVHAKSPPPSVISARDKMDKDAPSQCKVEQFSPQIKENGALSQGEEGSADCSMRNLPSVKRVELDEKPEYKGAVSNMDPIPKARDATPSSINENIRASGQKQGSSLNIVNENTKSSSVTTDKNAGTDFRLQTAWELKQMSASKDLAFSPESTPMKVLIAAAQAKRLLSRSNSVIDKPSSSFPSPSAYLRENSSDKLNHLLGKSPDPSPRQRFSSQQLGINETRSGPALAQSEKLLKHVYQHAEANAQLKSFEALLCTLTRAKESIVRATRHAIECARIGIAAEVVQSILLNLEKELSLHRRVDLFFLVDSITRSCRGSAGEVYPSLFLTVLPRLLSAAAPPGIAACENRRQCLKVLRLWLDRKAFPDSIIRHHIRELESVNDVSFSNGFSRRPSRTERAMDDPVREMEGMLVDEYGSNTSFHLPGLLDSRIDSDEGSDDDKSFEAVTPEGDAKMDDSMKPTEPLVAEKHKHILEEVDGELEMEDVAPPNELEGISSYHGQGSNTSHSAGRFDDHQPLTFAPPLPEERPPSPPPLPSSPPPPPSEASPSSVHTPAVSNTPTDFVSSNDYVSVNRTQNCLSQSINFRPDVISSDTSQYYAPGYRDLSNQKQLSATSLGPTYGSNMESRPGSDNLSVGNAPSNKAYYLQPPTPVMSNQFSYMQAESQSSQSRCENNPVALSQPIHFGKDQLSSNSLNGHSPQGSAQHDRCSSFAAAGPLGNINSDKAEATSNSVSYYGPSANSPLPNQGWAHPPVASSYQYSVPASRPPATTIPRMAGAPPGYWRPH